MVEPLTSLWAMMNWLELSFKVNLVEEVVDTVEWGNFLGAHCSFSGQVIKAGSIKRGWRVKERP